MWSKIVSFIIEAFETTKWVVKGDRHSSGTGFSDASRGDVRLQSQTSDITHICSFVGQKCSNWLDNSETFALQSEHRRQVTEPFYASHWHLLITPIVYVHHKVYPFKTRMPPTPSCPTPSWVVISGYVPQRPIGGYGGGWYPIWEPFWYPGVYGGATYGGWLTNWPPWTVTI